MRPKSKRYLNKIRKYRVWLGYTQSEMAERLNVALATYTRYENYHTLPNYIIRVKLCRIFGIKENQLFINELSIDDKIEMDLVQLEKRIGGVIVDNYFTKDITHRCKHYLINDLNVLYKKGDLNYKWFIESVKNNICTLKAATKHE